IRLTFGRWIYRKINEEEFSQAETKRAKLIKLKKIGSEFVEKRHSGAIYTSRPLNSLISKFSSISTISFGKRGISKKNFRKSSSYTIKDYRYISTELDLDINTERSQNLSSSIQNFSTSLKKRRNVEFLNVETHDNN
ncbi:16406_t:CDS:2, partial [Rhizophagus irregularis]